ncbi:hypothetical protein [Flavilitoribacter nigricans]|nr:hypothetical protein [Flavilitoribacter nigricans]
MNKFFLIAILLFLRGILFGQDDLIGSIEHNVDLIDRDSTLEMKEFDANQVYGHTYDGGGVISVHFDRKGIRKIKEEIGISTGRLTTIIYLKEGDPIKIIEREENFAHHADKPEMDYSRLHQVFQTEIYIFNWEKDHTQVRKKGARNFSEESCGLFEYEPLIALVREQMKK